MNENLVQAILEMIQAGGNAAIVVYIVHVAGEVLKWGVGFGCILMSVRWICRTIKEYLDTLDGGTHAPR